jgi:hypothetical protein
VGVELVEEEHTSARRSLPSEGIGGNASANGSAGDDLIDLTALFAFCVGFKTFPSDLGSHAMLMAKVARGPAVVVFDLEPALLLVAAESEDFLGLGLVADMVVINVANANVLLPIILENKSSSSYSSSSSSSYSSSTLSCRRRPLEQHVGDGRISNETNQLLVLISPWYTAFISHF